jgi:hypothetical protein
MAKLPGAQFVLTDHALVAVGLIFNSILRSIAVHREQANNSILALCPVIDSPIREKFHCLVQMEFVPGMFIGLLNHQKERWGIGRQHCDRHALLSRIRQNSASR